MLLFKKGGQGKNLLRLKVMIKMSEKNFIELVKDNEGYYPTPAPLIEKMLGYVDFSKETTFLEPSAGDGRIAKAIGRIGYKSCYRNYNKISVDCIEIDERMRNVIEYTFSSDNIHSLSDKIDSLSRRWDPEARSYIEPTAREQEEIEALKKAKDEVNITARVIADDFLEFSSYKKYDCIVMNPPYANGSEHLLHALELQRNGGKVICLLNAETIKNPYTNSRKLLVKELEKYGATIEFLTSAFKDADRVTDVEVALIVVEIEPPKRKESYFWESLKKEAEYKSQDPDNGNTALNYSDFIDGLIAQYNFEVSSTIRLIEEFEAFKPHMLTSLDDPDLKYPILNLSLGSHHSYYSGININEYLCVVREKYWSYLLQNKQFIGSLTSNLRDKYTSMISSMKEYEFSKYNISVIAKKMVEEMSSGVEDSILELFETLSAKHSWFPECDKNIHYFNGWKTNKAHMINPKKVIIPMHGAFASSWSSENLNTYTIYSVLSDLEKVFNYLSLSKDSTDDISAILKIANATGTTKNIEFKYFYATFYKKGTCHLTFKDEKLIEKLNIYGSRKKGWLPPCYGKKSYSDMDPEERAVIDEFQGEEKYKKIMLNKEFFLIEQEQFQLACS